MKILVATMPFAGHVGPLMPIAAHLVEVGHEVGWYLAPELRARVERLGVVVHPYRHATAVTDENIGDLFPERARLRGPKRLEFDFDHVFGRPIAGHVQDVRELRERFPFELLIADSAFFALSILGPTLGVATYVVEAGPVVLRSKDVPPPFFGLKPMLGLVGRTRDRLMWRIVHGTARAGIVSLNAARRASGLPDMSVEQAFEMIYDAADRVFQVGIPETDFPRGDPRPKLQYVGALLPPARASRRPLDPRIDAWNGPVVVVSQGTIDNRDPSKLIEPTIRALEGSGALTVAMTGGVGTDLLRRRHPRPDVVIEDYIDFAALFPVTDLFVTNGGHGSVMLALSHRVPMVLAGTREGKNDINARLEVAGLGPNLHTERPSVRRLRRAIDSVLAGSSYRERVARVGAVLDSYDSIRIVDEAMREDFGPSASPIRAAADGEDATA